MNEGDILQGRYRIEKEIGRGGMGVLYLAGHNLMPRKFAIKSLLPGMVQSRELRERFLAELNNHSQMEHPNIVQVTDCFEENDQLYVVMEYVDGTDLEKKIKNAGRLKELEALKILRDILEAVQYAHKKNIIHRDIKPSNILIGSDNRPRVTDFGIAILSNARRLTSTSSAPIGTPCYMSPEQIRTPMNIDHRSDIYSLGILLYEMLSGDVPFDGETEFSIQEQQVSSPVPTSRLLSAGISESVARIIRKAMEKDAAMRYQDCAAFIKDIDAFINPPRLRPWKIIALSLGLAVILGIIIYAFIPKEVIFNTVEVTDPKQQHETAYTMIEGATEQAVFFCTKQAELPLKLTNLKIAEKNGYFDLIDSYKNQIHEIEATMADSTSKYAGFISQLKTIEASIVDEEFQRYKEHLNQTGRANQIGKTEHIRQAKQTGRIDIEPSCKVAD